MSPRFTLSSTPASLYHGVLQAIMLPSHKVISECWCLQHTLNEAIFTFAFFRCEYILTERDVQYVCTCNRHRCQVTPNMLKGMRSKGREVKSLLLSNKFVFRELQINEETPSISWDKTLDVLTNLKVHLFLKIPQISHCVTRERTMKCGCFFCGDVFAQVLGAYCLNRIGSNACALSIFTLYSKMLFQTRACEATFFLFGSQSKVQSKNTEEKITKWLLEQTRLKRENDLFPLLLFCLFVARRLWIPFLMYNC